jgi:pyrroline-5-carboxylate reductase
MSQPDAAAHATPPAFAFVGCGNLGSAILARAVGSGALDVARTLVCESDPARRARAAALGVRTSADAADARGARTLLLAVKPQSFHEVAAQLAPLPGDALVISVMAGWGSAAIGQALGGAVRVVRAMPNTPAQVGCAMTAVAPGAGAAEADVAEAERIFGAVGRTARITEGLIDAAVAAGGSGPAYLFLLAEAQEAGARALGLDPATARAMTVQTILGAAQLLAQDGRDAAALRAAVTSKGGTTAAAIAVLEQRGFAQAVADAMRAAHDRSAELGA